MYKTSDPVQSLEPHYMAKLNIISRNRIAAKLHHFKAKVLQDVYAFRSYCSDCSTNVFAIMQLYCSDDVLNKASLKCNNYGYR